jgi:hypothetical protein
MGCGVEGAAPTPLVDVTGDACASTDCADVDLAIVDVRRLSVRIVTASAGR